MFIMLLYYLKIKRKQYKKIIYPKDNDVYWTKIMIKLILYFWSS